MADAALAAASASAGIMAMDGDLARNRAGTGSCVTSRYNPRMKIVLNGESREVAATTSLAQLLEQSGYGARRIAVEVNREIVPRSRHAGRGLVEGDRIEIVHAIGGG